MPALGAITVIIQDGKVLLTRRGDFHVWCLPGGHVDDGETVADAAIREAREEVGLEVRLTRLIGVYSRPGGLNGGMHVLSFAAQVVGGQITPDPVEVLEVRFFGRDELPEAMMFGHRQRALDGLDGVSGAVWLQDAAWDFPPQMTRRELYQQMADSGLAPEEFYRRYVGCPGGRGEARRPRNR